MNRRSRWITAAALLLIAVAGVVGWRLLATRQTGAAPPASSAAAATASAPGVALDLGTQDVLVLRRVELVQTLAVSGGIKAVNSAMVKAKVAGELLTLAVREGDVVKAGQVLGQIDPADNESRLRQALESVAAAQAQLDIAQRTLKNNQALVDQNFISRNALDTSVSNAASAAANLRAAQAAAELARKALKDALLVAPIAGSVAQRLMQPGERAALDARIIELVDLSQLELEAAIAPEDIVALRVGQRARLQIDGLAGTVQASVVRINPSTQAGTRAVTAYLRLHDQPAGLRQGLFASGQIELARHSSLAVPLSLVRIDQAQPHVLALVDGRVVQRKVVLGLRGEARFEAEPAPTATAVEILQGLGEGDTLLRGAVGAVRAGTPARLAGR